MSNVEREQRPNSKGVSHTHTPYVSEMVCKWIIVSAIAFSLSLFLSPTCTSFGIAFRLAMLWQCVNNGALRLPLNTRRAALVCHRSYACTLALALALVVCTVFQAVRLSERHITKLANKRHGKALECEWKRERKKSKYCDDSYAVKDTTKYIREEKTKTQTQKNTFFLCFIVYATITLSFFCSAPCLFSVEFWMTHTKSSRWRRCPAAVRASRKYCAVIRMPFSLETSLLRSIWNVCRCESRQPLAQCHRSNAIEGVVLLCQRRSTRQNENKKKRKKWIFFPVRRLRVLLTLVCVPRTPEDTLYSLDEATVPYISINKYFTRSKLLCTRT